MSGSLQNYSITYLVPVATQLGADSLDACYLVSTWHLLIMQCKVKLSFANKLSVVCNNPQSICARIQCHPSITIRNSQQ